MHYDHQIIRYPEHNPQSHLAAHEAEAQLLVRRLGASSLPFAQERALQERAKRIYEESTESHWLQVVECVALILNVAPHAKLSDILANAENLTRRDFSEPANDDDIGAAFPPSDVVSPRLPSANLRNFRSIR